MSMTAVMLGLLFSVCATFGVALVLRDRRLTRQRSEFVDAQVAAIEEMKKRKNRRTP